MYKYCIAHIKYLYALNATAALIHFKLCPYKYYICGVSL